MLSLLFRPLVFSNEFLYLFCVITKSLKSCTEVGNGILFVGIVLFDNLEMQFIFVWFFLISRHFIKPTPQWSITTVVLVETRLLWDRHRLRTTTTNMMSLVRFLQVVHLWAAFSHSPVSKSTTFSWRWCQAKRLSVMGGLFHVSSCSRF